MDMFSPRATVVLTSTTSSQTTVVPNGFRKLVAYNAGSNPVYMTFGSTVAVPGTTWTDNKVMCVQPSTTQTFDIPVEGGTLAYIASSAGGSLTLSIGQGV